MSATFASLADLDRKAITFSRLSENAYAYTAARNSRGTDAQRSSGAGVRTR